VREACSFQATCLNSFNDQTIPFIVALRASHRDLQGVGASVTDDQRYRFDKLFFLLSLFFIEKIQKYLFIYFIYPIWLIFIWFFICSWFFNFIHRHFVSFNLYIKFDPHYFNSYLFFFILFLIEFFFKFYPLVFNFNLFLCQIWYVFFLLLFVINPYLIIFFSILSLNILWLRILIFYFFRVCFIWS